MPRLTQISCLPHLLLVAWLSFVGWAIWQHVERTEQPPIYDALTYAEKARAFWANLERDKPINPFNLEPTVRPPGTVLMSYPFGFTEDPRGFFYRSIFIPILLLVAAVYIIGFTADMSQARRWDLALLAMYLSSLPMFYHFEWSPGSNSQVYWGLVDNFLAAIAALATAAILRSARDISLGWLTAGAFLLALCFLTKPAGVLLIASLAISWFLIVVLRWLWATPSQVDQRAILRFLCFGSASFVLILGPIIYIGFSSKYFSAEHMAFANQVLIIMGEEWLTLTPSMLHTMIHTSTGYPLLFGVLAVWLPTIIRWRRDDSLPPDKPMLIGLSATAFIATVIGMWFWIFKTSGSQVRHFYPFALIVLIALLPLAQRHLTRLSGTQRTTVRTALVLHFLTIGTLLSQVAPPIEPQRRIGINLSSGTLKPEVRMGKALVDEVLKGHTDVSLYTVGGSSAAVVESVIERQWAFHRRTPSMVVKRPFDWLRPSVYRLNEIYEADYVLFEPIRDRGGNAAACNRKSIRDLRQETDLFNAWFTDAHARQGIAMVSETPTLRLLRVTDSTALEAALRDLKGQHVWRPEFVAANPQVWSSKHDLTDIKTASIRALEGTRFGEHFELDAIGLDRRGSHVDVRLWWHRLGYTPDKEWYFFFHSIDSNGTIIGNHNLRLTHRTPLRPEDNIRFDETRFGIPADSTIEAIAFGIYGLHKGVPDPLPASKGPRDWNGRRVIIPLPNAQSIARETR